MKLPKTCKSIDSYNNSYPQGSECVFVSCGNGWGLKLFSSRYERDFAVEKQTQLHKHNLAPKVGKVFELQIKGKIGRNLYRDPKSYVYGYITQKAKMVEKPGKKDRKNLNSLVRKLGYLSSPFMDAGFHNVGYINKKLVVIDCNSLSFEDYSS